MSIGLVALILDGGHEHYSEVLDLLDQGHSVNETDEWGDTALHAAAIKGRNLLVKVLLERGADPDATNHAGSTPLHKAAVGGHLAVARTLMEHGAKTDVLNLAERGADFYAIDLALRAGLTKEALLEESAPQTVPKKMQGLFIGKRGEKLKEIRLESGLQSIRLDDATGRITFNGSAAAIARANRLVESLFAEIAQNGTRVRQGGQRETTRESVKRAIAITVHIAPELHGRIIGPKGQKIRKLEQETNTRITIPREENNDKIMVEGDRPEDVDLAVERIHRSCEAPQGNAYRNTRNRGMNMPYGRNTEPRDEEVSHQTSAEGFSLETFQAGNSTNNGAKRRRRAV